MNDVQRHLEIKATLVEMRRMIKAIIAMGGHTPLQTSAFDHAENAIAAAIAGNNIAFRQITNPEWYERE